MRNSLLLDPEGKNECLGKTMKHTELADLTLSDLKARGGDAVKQAVIALHMAVQEPAISKLERKRLAAVQLDKLQRYLTAIGGKLEVKVTLPDGTVLGSKEGE